MRFWQSNDQAASGSAAGRPTALLIGDWERSELGEAVAVLRSRTDLLAVAGMEPAVRLLAGGGESGAERIWPDLLVLAQVRPGRFSDHDVARLKRYAPVARVLGLLGSWCEGETRTGTAWPASERCFWYQWPARFESELERIARGRCPTWGLPETASLDERTLWTSATSDSTRRGQGTLLVAARSTDTADAVGDACCEAGLAATVVCRQTNGRMAGPQDTHGIRPLVGAIWEGTQCEAFETARLVEFCAWLNPTPVVVLLDFPRHGSRARALSAGATGVVGKPFQLDDLVWQLRKAMSKELQLD